MQIYMLSSLSQTRIKSTNAYPTTWSDFGEECWDDLTRASECAKDDVRDPQSGPFGVHGTHRIHWINTRIDDMVDIITALGKEHFKTDDFHISKWKLLDLKKYYHRWQLICTLPSEHILSPLNTLLYRLQLIVVVWGQIPWS